MSATAIVSNGGVDSTDFLVASFDGIHLLFHDREVRSVEMIDDLELPSPEQAGAFSYCRGVDEYPVFALDRAFGILPTIPAQRQHFILLANESGDFGIACNQTSFLRRANKQLMPLPECMQSPISPIQGAMLVADAVGFYCPPSRFAAYLFFTRE